MAEFDPKDPAIKQALKEGLQEWLDEKHNKFSRWTLSSLVAGALAGLVYLALIGLGWIKP